MMYRAAPNKTLAKEASSGGKVNKERITIALTVNSDGSDRLRPLVISTAKKHRCFGKTFDPESVVDYHHNQKAWMNGQVCCHAST